MFQRGLALATELARMPERLDRLSIPRFSLFDRTSGRFGSLAERPIKQGFFVNFTPYRLQPCQTLSRDQRKQKWTWWGEKLRPNLGAYAQAEAAIAAIDLSPDRVKCQNQMVISAEDLFALLVKGCIRHLSGRVCWDRPKSSNKVGRSGCCGSNGALRHMGTNL